MTGQRAIGGELRVALLALVVTDARVGQHVLAQDAARDETFPTLLAMIRALP